MIGQPAVRHSVQVLIFDPDDRVLLLRSAEPETGVTMWGPVGGGIEPGEDVYAAARREVAEETGLAGVDLGSELWRRQHVYSWRGMWRDSRERWFCARAARFEPSRANLSEQERIYLVEHRWWSIDDLTDTTDAFTPSDLPMRVRGLLTYGPPDLPTELRH